VFLWDLRAGKLSRKWTSLPEGNSLSFHHAFTPDAKTLVHASSGHIFLWDVQTGKEQWHIETKKDDYLNGLSVSPNGQLLATRHDLGRIELRQVKTGRFVREIAVQVNSFGPVFSPDSKNVLCVNENGEVRFWDVDKAKCTRRLRGGPEARAESLTFSPDAQYLAGGGSDHAIHL